MEISGKDALVNLLLLLAAVLSGFVLYTGVVAAGVYSTGADWQKTEGIPSPADWMQHLDRHGMLVLQLLSHLCALILPAAVLSRLRPSVRSYYATTAPDLKTGLLILAFFISAIPLTSVMGYLNNLIPLPEWLNSKEEEIGSMIRRLLEVQGIPDYLYIVVTIALVPAIAEEWIFRGIVQNQLSRIYRSPWTAILVTSIIFSAIHFQFQGFLPRFGLGFLLGTAYYLGGNMIYPIALHFLFNGVQVVYVGMTGVETLDDKSYDLWRILPAALAGSVPCYYFFMRLIQTKRSRT